PSQLHSLQLYNISRQNPTLTLSLTAVRDSTVSSQLGQGTVDCGTMSLSSLVSPAASGSTLSRALPSAPGTRLDPATPGGPGVKELEGLDVLFDPLSPPKTSLLSDVGTSSPLLSIVMPSMLASLLGNWLS
ncbi:hypothetical protein XENOCAPTIV_019599, partial [Xenoophorus captivus]